MAGDTAAADSTQATESSTTTRAPGQSLLPVARIKKIVKLDKDIAMINAEAVQAVSFATELFMEYLANEGFTKAQKSKPPRKTIFYKDLADVVQKTDSFQFLEDVIPHTISLEEGYRRRRKAGIDDGVEVSTEPSQKRQRKKKQPAEQEPEQEQLQDMDEDETELASVATSSVAQDQETATHVAPSMPESDEENDDDEDEVEGLDDDMEEDDQVDEEDEDEEEE